MGCERRLTGEKIEKIIFFRQPKQSGKIIKFREKSIQDEFEAAVQNEEFLIYYQPKVNADTEEIIGAEALVRWKKRNGSYISPAEFIPQYEKNGLIEALDEYVFRQVCSYQKKRMLFGKILFPISVNVSRISILDSEIAERYTKIARDYEIPCSCIPIEITESSAVYSEKMKETADKFVSNGFSLQIDDFGAGYSSLQSLMQLPFTTLKLDKTLIDNVGKSKGKVILEQSILLAKMLGMDVIAEGVEKKEQIEILRKMNCSNIQGYYYAKPMPEEQFEKILSDLVAINRKKR